jgi:hypothetical protein
MEEIKKQINIKEYRKKEATEPVGEKNKKRIKQSKKHRELKVTILLY